MTDDLLRRATRALREEGAGDDATAQLTRSRILASASEGRVRRRTRLAFLLPIAATFVAASALGASGSARHALEAVARAFGIHAAPPPVRPPEGAARHPSGPARAPRPAAPPPAPQASALPASETAPEAPVVEAARVAPTRTEPAPRSAEVAPGRPSAPDPAFDLYRAAHQAHFVEHDSERALGAWDAYLRAAPTGALAVEARYNRALCLVRLHRTAEARAALAPFAQGRFGGYRRDEAVKLTEALAP